MTRVRMGIHSIKRENETYRPFNRVIFTCLYLFKSLGKLQYKNQIKTQSVLPTRGSSDCYSESIKTLQSTDWKPLIWSCHHFPDGKTVSWRWMYLPKLVGKPDLEAGLLTPALACINTTCLLPEVVNTIYVK